MALSSILAVSVGGALGALARYGMGHLASQLVDLPFPTGTWTVNLLGCLLIGLSVPFFGDLIKTEEVRLFFVTGLLGSFTTFSTFSLDTFALWAEGQGLTAFINAVGSVVLGLLFVAVGVRLANIWL